MNYLAEQLGDALVARVPEKELLTGRLVLKVHSNSALDMIIQVWPAGQIIINTSLASRPNYYNLGLAGRLILYHKEKLERAVEELRRSCP